MWNEFVTMMLLAFAIVTLATGLLTAYFGSGVSRGIGILLTLLGLVTGFFFVSSVFGVFTFQPLWDPGFVLNCIAAVAGALIGISVGLGLFLVAIIKG